jgi:SAM-dependent methyltransferase
MSFKSEEEIRPKNIFKELLKCCEEDAIYLSKVGDFVEISCPACGSETKENAFVKNNFNFQYCKKCHSLYNSPRPTQNSFNSFYPKSKSSQYFFESFYPAVEASRKIKLIPERVERVASFINQMSKGKKVILDIGGGQGFFFDLLRLQFPDFEYRVIEPNAELAEVCIDKGYKTIIDFVENVAEWESEVDFIVCFEVFEHIVNPIDFLEKFKRMLKPGGKLLITTLSGDGLDISLLNEDADIVAPPQHLNFFSIKGFNEIFKRLGFNEIFIQTPGKLDVNIVINKSMEIEKWKQDSLVNFLINLNEENRTEFQKFLEKNLLSSHIWVVATL